MKKYEKSLNVIARPIQSELSSSTGLLIPSLPAFTMNVLPQIENSPNEIIITIATKKPILYDVHPSKKCYLDTSIDCAYHYAMALGVAEASCDQT